MSNKRWSVLVATIKEELNGPLTRLLREQYACEVDTVHRRQDLMPRLQGAKLYHAVLLDDLLFSSNGEGDRGPGVELITEIKRVRPATEIVVSTGGDSMLGRLAMQKGAICCAQTPIDLEYLALQVCQAAEFQRRANGQDVLGKLMNTNLALHGEKNEEELLDAVLKGVQSFGFDRVRLYLLSGDGMFLEAVASVGMDTYFKHARLPLKDCHYMNELLKARRSLVFKRSDSDMVPFEQLLDKADVDGWAGVPMSLNDVIMGKLSVDNKHSGLSILEGDLVPLEVCAAHAARAIQNRRAVDRAGRRVETLESLRKAAVKVMEQSHREALLDTITDEAMKLVGADGCGIYALQNFRDGSPGKLIIIKDHTRPDLETRELEVGQGLAGRLVKSDKPYWIVEDYDTWEWRAPELVGVFGTVLEVPLRWESRPIGVLYVDNPVGHVFTPEEGELLSLFAQHAASALAHIERNDDLERLLSSSPIGIIAADARGKVDRVNDAALSMLKRSKHEVMGTYIGPLFKSEGEERKIGRLLRENGGKFPNYRTEIRTSEGTTIPILHSSTWRYDSAGNPAGSIAFFEDLRPIQLLTEASDIVTRATNPSAGLRELAERMASLLPQTFCRILLVDGTNEKLTVKAAQFPPTDPQSATHSNAALKHPIVLSDWSGLRELLEGHEHSLFRSGKGQVSPFLKHYSEHLGLDEIVQSLLVVPLKVEGEPVGLFEFGQLRSDQPFTEQQTQFAISIAANTAALIRRIQFQEATERRNQELTRENQAIQMISGMTSVKAALLTITTQAKQVFECVSATIWPYDTLGQRFIPRELTSDGISGEILNRIRKAEPSQGGITNAVRTLDWVGVEDILDPSLEFLTPYMRELLASAGIKSFQGVHLRVGDEETVGILYVSYPTVREFDEQDRGSLEKFGAYAALALKNARSSEQLRKAKASSQAVARVIALGDLKDTLRSVCREMVRLTGCHVAVLYPYDEIRDRLGSPPTHHGKVRYPDRMMRLQEVPPDSLIRKFLDEKRTMIIEDTLAQSSPLKRSRFTRDEKILSSVVVPLRVADRRVGVMFVNYRSPHRFTSDEIANIQLICQQAAIAVSNVQHYDRVKRHLNGQNELLNLSGSLLEQLRLKDILRMSIKTAFAALRADFSNIVLLDDGGDLIFRAGEGWPADAEGQVLGRGNGSQTGYTIEARKPIHVYDYALEDRFIVPEMVKEQKISSGLSVPMFDRGEVIGALLVHSKRHRRFSEREEQLLQLTANHTAIAIENAKRLKANERKSTRLRALNEAAKAITKSFGSDNDVVLDKILERAVACIGQRDGLDTILGTLHMYNEDAKEVVFAAAHPYDQADPIEDRIRKPRSTNRTLEPRIGVIGRTAETGEAQIVADVSSDPDFVAFKWDEGSEITAPLINGDKVQGVINVECNLVGAFDEEDKETLKALADLAVIALQNAQRYDELRQINGLIGSRSVQEWMMEIWDAWWHEIKRDIFHANASIDDLKSSVPLQMRPKLDRLRDILMKVNPENKLRHFVDDKAKPIKAWDFINKQVDIFQEKYSDIGFELKNPIDDRIIIRASLYKLQFVLENLVYNAVQAMERGKNPRGVITFTLDVLPEPAKLRISISDTGPGIPENIQHAINMEERIVKKPEEVGMGIGLMLVRAFLTHYQGKIKLARTGPEGTEFIITLPYQISET